MNNTSQFAAINMLTGEQVFSDDVVDKDFQNTEDIEDSLLPSKFDQR